MSNDEYAICFNNKDMHYQVWIKNDWGENVTDEDLKEIELLMRFVNKDQAIGYFDNLGIELKDCSEVKWIPLSL